MADQSENLASDRLRGVAAIAEYIGENPRRVFTLLQRGALPAQKELNIWVALKSRLRAHYNNPPPAQ
jgi:hypothetical protein